jgi:hypothetical protein
MQPAIYELKKEILELERAGYIKDLDQTRKVLNRIRFICDEIEDGTVEIPEVTISYKRINKLPFIYKPILRKDYFKGDYLEKFSLERTMQLKEADALITHNNFWKEHEDVKGNVFGSLPVDMMTTKSFSKLLQMGWCETNVNVIDFNKENVEEKTIIRFCEKTFEQFILVKEKATGTYLALEYETKKTHL